MGWVYVFIAGIIEVFWVIGLKEAESFRGYAIVAALIVLSFYILFKAYKYIPVSVVYAVFTGIGAAGVAVSEILFYGGSLSFLKIFFIFIILAGVAGLKFTGGK